MSGRELSTLRVSDADRERVVAALRTHYAAGRLDDDELAARTAQALAAVDGAALQGPLENLPDLGPAERRGSLSTRIHASVFVVVNAVLVAVWAVLGGGYFWPGWSLLGWGAGLATHALVIGAVRRNQRARVRRLPPAERRAPDGTVTMLFSDIAGSTELNARLGDVAWLALLRRHHDVVRGQVRAHGGYEVKEQGDGFMVAFVSARRALDCATGIQDAIAAEFDDGSVRVRIGLHTGEMIRDRDDFYGKNVALAARIASAAQPGETLASAVVHDLAESRGDVRFTGPRDVELKGLGTQPVYAVTR